MVHPYPRVLLKNKKQIIDTGIWMSLQGAILNEKKKKKAIFKSMLYVWSHFEIASF